MNRRPCHDPGTVCIWFTAGIGAWAAAAIGCGSRLPTTIPVKGVVTWRGAPLESGKVMFELAEPHTATVRRPAVGALQPGGRYELTTFRAGDGAMPGKHVVTIHSFRTDPNADPELDVVKPVWLIPSRYGDPATSGLSADVPAAGPAVREVDFQLE